MIDQVSVINNALSRFGGGEIDAIDEDTELAGTVVPIYDDVIPALLGLYEWSFNARTYALDALSETPENEFDSSANKFRNGWRYGFALPGDRLAPPRRILTDPRLPDQPLRQYAIEGGNIYAERTPLWATVSVDADPDVWWAPFRMAATTLLASEFALAVSHDKDLAGRLLIRAQGTSDENGKGGLVGQAISFDAARSRIKAPMQTDPLGDARFG